MSDGVQAVLDDPASQTKALVNPHIGEVPLPDAVVVLLALHLGLLLAASVFYALRRFRWTPRRREEEEAALSIGPALVEAVTKIAEAYGSQAVG